MSETADQSVEIPDESSGIIESNVSGNSAIAEASSVSDNQDESLLADEGATEKTVRLIVEEFGENLAKVSLVAPADILEKEMKESYSGFISEELMERWIEDPSIAFGKLTSSPWPDRIEILTVDKIDKNTYSVSGEVIEMTSVEVENGGYSGKYPVELKVELSGSNWVIMDAVKGEYE